MADISKFSIVTYERKPGHWRAAVTRKVRAGIVVGGDKVRSIVTRDEYASESEAQVAAEKLIANFDALSEAKILSELAAKNPRVPMAG